MWRLRIFLRGNARTTPSSPRGRRSMMMRGGFENILVSLSILQERRDAGDRRGARFDARRNFPVGETFPEEARRIESLAHGFHLRKGRNIPEEICDFPGGSALQECLAESAECRFRSPATFCETPLHAPQGTTLCDMCQRVNTVVPVSAY